MDIVVAYDGAPTGFLATDAEQYAACMARILDMPDAERRAMQLCARRSVADRFSEAAFLRHFGDACEPLFAA